MDPTGDVLICILLLILFGERDGVMVKALRYKTAGHGFDSRLRHRNFSVT